MGSVMNYSAYYKLTNTAKLFTGMNAANPVQNASKTQFSGLAAANDSKLSMIMEKRATNQANGYQAFQGFQKDSAAFSKSLNSVTSNLKASAQSLMQYSQTSVVNPKSYGSKDGSVASVTADSTSSTSTKNPISLAVKQTAKAESAKTDALSSSERSLGGNSSITLTSADGKKSQKLNFNFSYSTTNKEAMSQMAEKVNQSGMGITATVVEKDGKSSLSITSDKTGTDAGFTAKIGGSAAPKLNLATVTTAQNAEYTENGVAKASQTNDIKVAEGKVSVTLKSAGSTTLEQAVKDNASIVDAAKRFAGDYNAAVDLFSKNKDKSVAMASIASSFSSAKYSQNKLSEIGINVDSNGKLAVDSTKLTAALEKTPDKVRDILSGKDGLASSAYQKATTAKQNERRLYPPTPDVTSFANTSYNRNMNFVTTYLSGTFLNSLI